MHNVHESVSPFTLYLSVQNAYNPGRKQFEKTNRMVCNQNPVIPNLPCGAPELQYFSPTEIMFLVVLVCLLAHITPKLWLDCNEVFLLHTFLPLSHTLSLSLSLSQMKATAVPCIFKIPTTPVYFPNTYSI